jgi:hypothetical protein
VLLDRGFGSGDYLLVFTRLQASMKEPFEGEALEFFQSHRLGLGPRSVGHVLQGSPAPQSESFAKRYCSCLCIAFCQLLRPDGIPTFEFSGVDAGHVQAQNVPGRASLEAVSQDLPLLHRLTPNPFSSELRRPRPTRSSRSWMGLPPNGGKLPPRKGVGMADKSPRKVASKKSGKSLKEKRKEKKEKHEVRKGLGV